MEINNLKDLLKEIDNLEVGVPIFFENLKGQYKLVKTYSQSEPKTNIAQDNPNDSKATDLHTKSTAQDNSVPEKQVQNNTHNSSSETPNKKQNCEILKGCGEVNFFTETLDEPYKCGEHKIYNT